MHPHVTLQTGLEPLGAVVGSESDDTGHTETQTSEHSCPSFASTTSVGEAANSLLSELVLSDSNAGQVVGNARAEEQWADESGHWGCDGSSDLNEGAWGDALVVSGGGVVEQVKDTADIHGQHSRIG